MVENTAIKVQIGCHIPPSPERVVASYCEISERWGWTIRLTMREKKKVVWKWRWMTATECICCVISAGFRGSLRR